MHIRTLILRLYCRNIFKIKNFKWPDSTYIHFIISVILLWLLCLKSQSVHTTTDTTIYYLWLMSSAQIILQLQPQNGIALTEKHHYVDFNSFLNV